MSYSIAQAALLADQLERLATQAAHQIVGHSANLGFWLAEAEHALGVIDDYPSRFQRQRDSQGAWVEAHATKVAGYCAHCGGACEVGPRKPDSVRRVPAQELADARAAVRRGARRLVLRLHRARLIRLPELQAACDRLGIVLESEDLSMKDEQS